MKFSSKENETKAKERDDKEKHHPTLKERQEKFYLFPNFNSPVEKYFVLKELILKLTYEKKIELDIDEVTQTNHVAVKMTSAVRFQQKIMLIDSQNKEEPMVGMDSHDSSKRETTKFHSKGVLIPSKAWKRKQLSQKEGEKKQEDVEA
uniref:Retrotransposon gag protein n=1 Tax=Cucumis melo TaxID=3656 RepID=A0A9I9EF40_CUCME